MTDNVEKKSQPRSKLRIKREAEALKKNLLKRKLQQAQREQNKKDLKNG